MKNTILSTGTTLRVAVLILTLGATSLLLVGTGCASGSRYEQSAGERLDDRNTSSFVRTALAGDPEYKYDGVSVETLKGTVQLSGFVVSNDQKARAALIAKKVTSVKEVINNIIVKESAN